MTRKAKEKGFKTHWTNAQNKRLRELFHQGKTDAQIVEAMRKERPGITKVSVGYQRVQLGLRRRGTVKGRRGNGHPPPPEVKQPGATIRVITDTMDANFRTDVKTAGVVVSLIVEGGGTLAGPGGQG